MADNLQTIIAALDGITSVNDEAQLAILDNAIQSLMVSDHPELGTRAMLGCFERFPDDDVYGVFWTILHGLESVPGYESALVESVRRHPSLFGLTMINRILNAGGSVINGIDLLALLQDVSQRSDLSEVIKNEAKEFVMWQHSRA